MPQCTGDLAVTMSVKRRHRSFEVVISYTCDCGNSGTFHGPLNGKLRGTRGSRSHVERVAAALRLSTHSVENLTKPPAEKPK